MFFRKAKHIQLSIPDPCSQSWEGMTPVNGGRHCAQCSKTVTDFTSMTDRELFMWFKSGHSTCGQFYADQLERAIAAPREPKHSFWMKLGVAFITLMGFAKEGRAQDKKTAPVAAMPSPSAEESTSISAPETSRTGIQGIITDDKNEGIPGALVTVKDSSGHSIAITQTDVNGEYLITVIPENVSVCEVTFSSPGASDMTYVDVPITRGQITKLDYHIKSLSALEQQKTFKMVGAISIRRMTQPEGVHTVHKMKDWE